MPVKRHAGEDAGVRERLDTGQGDEKGTGPGPVGRGHGERSGLHSDEVGARGALEQKASRVMGFHRVPLPAVGVSPRGAPWIRTGL